MGTKVTIAGIEAGQAHDFADAPLGHPRQMHKREPEQRACELTEEVFDNVLDINFEGCDVQARAAAAT